MSHVKAFPATRYSAKAGDLAQLVSPPYDVITDRLRDELTARNPQNVVKLILRKAEGRERYLGAANDFRNWIEEGILAREDRPAFYLYEQDFHIDGRQATRRGFIGLLELAEFGDGDVYPHEETLSGPKEDRYSLMDACRAGLEQIFGIYPDMSGGIARLIDEAFEKYPVSATVASDDSGHEVVNRIRIVTDPSVIARIEQAFRPVPVYIADGHHRYETSLKYMKDFRRRNRIASPLGSHPVDFVPIYLVSMSDKGLEIWPTHRVVYGIPQKYADDVRDKLRVNFRIRACADRNETLAEMRAGFLAGKTVFGMIEKNGTYTLLELKDPGLLDVPLAGRHAAVRRLDVTVLHKLILEDIFDIGEQKLRERKNIRYHKSVDETCDDLVSSDDAALAFLLNPTRVSDVMDVANAGEKMPQKSTYFFPKVLSGLVFYDHEET